MKITGITVLYFGYLPTTRRFYCQKNDSKIVDWLQQIFKCAVFNTRNNPIKFVTILYDKLEVFFINAIQ